MLEGAKDPISEKKLHKGDGRWDTTKEILGYMLNEVRAILKKKRVALKRFRSIVGRPRTACGTYSPSGESFLYTTIQCVAGPA
jgi:hypothetical protein